MRTAALTVDRCSGTFSEVMRGVTTVAASWTQGKRQERPCARTARGLVTGSTTKGPRKEKAMSEETVPFGRDKGKKLSEVNDLSWLHRVVTENVNDPGKERWRAKNQELLDAIDAELARRKGGGSTAKTCHRCGEVLEP